jgi:hypothetical protein
MKGSTQLLEIAVPDYGMYADRGDVCTAQASEICHHDLIKLDEANWLKFYHRLLRSSYSIPEWEVAQLEEMLANSRDTTQCIAISLRLADLQASGDWFKEACRLAQSASLEPLEQALYYEQDRERYITLVLALAHYELLNSFEFGEYVVKVGIVQHNGKFYRRYVYP